MPSPTPPPSETRVSTSYVGIRGFPRTFFPFLTRNPPAQLYGPFPPSSSMFLPAPAIGIPLTDRRTLYPSAPALPGPATSPVGGPLRYFSTGGTRLRPREIGAERCFMPRTVKAVNPIPPYRRRRCSAFTHAPTFVPYFAQATCLGFKREMRRYRPSRSGLVLILAIDDLLC